MIYLTTTDRKNHDIRFFLNRIDLMVDHNSYLILVIANEDDQATFGRQIERSHLAEVNWLLTTSAEFDALADQYGKPFLSLFLGEITLTNKKEVKLGLYPSWTLLEIATEHKTSPFDEAMAQVINEIVDQIFYKSDTFDTIRTDRFLSLTSALMNSGMFKMISNPRKYYGVG
jgi:hypothetical protein